MGDTGRSVNRLARPKLIALALATSALLVVAATALAATGDLSQPAGTAGCVSETGAGPCADGHALFLPETVAVSPDGKSVYATTAINAVVRFNRNPTTGAITQPAGTAGCVSNDGTGPCADGHALDSLGSVAVSPDGKSVYVASIGSDAVVRFNRNTTTGAISQPAGTAGCVSDEGAGPCANGHGLEGASSVAVSPDGKSVYVASQGTDSVASLDRTSTGAITQPAGPSCISESGAGTCQNGHGLDGAITVAVSPDGNSVYAASYISDAVVRIHRVVDGRISQPSGTAGCVSGTGAGPCKDGHALDGAGSVAVSPDGKSVYASSANSDAVVRLNRTSTGAIAQPKGASGCVSHTGAGACADGHALDWPGTVAVSADGKNVYVGSNRSHAVARFNRNTTTGAIAQPTGTAGCISDTEFGAEPCVDGHALTYTAGVAVSADGKSVYVAAYGGEWGAVARLNRVP